MTLFFMEHSELIIRLFVALFLGMMIGAERLLVHKDAGMKTHALVCLGSALFVVISEMVYIKYEYLAGFDPSRIASQIIVGIGFLGAGSIILHGSQLRGLTTAGGMWVTAGIGMAAGFGLYDIAVIGAILVMFIFVAVNMLEKPIRIISDEIDPQ